MKITSGKLGTKLTVAFLIVGVIPFLVASMISLWKASSALKEQAFSQLRVAREIKKAQLEKMFSEHSEEVKQIAGLDNVRDFFVEFENIGLTQGFDAEDYKGALSDYDPILKVYARGFEDLFLISKKGDVVYSVKRNADFASNLVTGKHKDTGLARAFKKALEGRVAFDDFSLYPLHGNELVSFLAAPLRDEGGTIIGVMATLHTIDDINGIMGVRSGLGKTGETYLVGQDKLMRSDSFHDPRHRSAKASLTNPGQGKVDTPASGEALSGKVGSGVITGYMGTPVLSSYSPLKVGDTTWAVIAEINKSEAFATISGIKWFITILAVVCIAAIIGVALLITRSITKPINAIIDDLNAGADKVAFASEKLSSSSQSLSEGTSEQSAGFEETSSSVEEMASMIKQNAENAGQANLLMIETSEVVEQANSSMAELTGSMGEISQASGETAKVVKTIDEIAFQTNLLALNAAVEAARAGEAGAGFAVVADEVRNLAMRAAEAAKNTAGLIEDTVKKIQDGSEVVAKTNEAFAKVAEGARKVRELVGEISSASDEQSQGVEQINKAVAEMDTITQQNAVNAEEFASTSDELSIQAERMQRVVDTLTAIITGSNQRTSGQRQVFTPGRPKSRTQRAVNTVPIIKERDGKGIEPQQIIPMEADVQDF
ncbi:MAG: methyl-accepting chemotaxis protein [Thermodesulfobacteriota bacterium]